MEGGEAMSRIDEIRKRNEWKKGLCDYCKGLDTFDVDNTDFLLSEIDRLREQLEIERIRLAACGVAAMANTEETIKQRIDKDNPYHSASYGDVCSAIDREIAYREEVKALESDREGWLDTAGRNGRRVVQLESALAEKDEFIECQQKRLEGLPTPDEFRLLIAVNEELRREVEGMKAELHQQFEESISIIHDEGAKRILAEGQIADLKAKLEAAADNLFKTSMTNVELMARLKPIEEVADKMGNFLMKQTDDCQNDADCVCPEMNILIDEWQAITK
jgi:hypothetical protein